MPEITLLDLLKVLGGGGVGGVIGALLTHHFTKDRDIINDKRILNRERQNRKRHFLGKLHLWKIRFQRTNPDTLTQTYVTFAGEFPYEAGLIEMDFTNREEFVKLGYASFSFTRADLEKGHQQARDNILATIAAMKQFAEAAA